MTDLFCHPVCSQEPPRKLHFFGNGTTALAGALKAFGLTGKAVAMPATVCPSVPAAVLASGNQPYLVDIDPVTGGISPAALEKAASHVSAVIAVHAYGIPCKIDDIANICRALGLPLVEDCAQAEGACYGDKPVGLWGDISVFSYGSGKILDLGGGGMALTADPQLFARLHAFHNSLPRQEDSTAGEDLAALYKFFYNRFFPHGLSPYFSTMAAALTDCGSRMLAQATQARITRIRAGWKNLGAEVAARQRKADIYRSQLANVPGLHFFANQAGTVPWRFMLHLEAGLRDRIFKRMLSLGMNVSSWYPSLSFFLAEDVAPRQALPNAVAASFTVLNLWLDENTTEDDICRTSRRLMELIVEETS